MGSTLPRLVIWGASGHARVVADIVRSAGVYEVVGFLDDTSPDRRGTEFCGAPVLGGQEYLGRLGAADAELIVAIGDCQARLHLAAIVQQAGFTLATAIHPRAVLADDVRVGAGTVVCAGAVVNPGTRVGENVIINTSASVDHECVIDDGVHVGPGARLGGRVQAHRGSWIGIGATVRDRITVGAGSLIGAGAVVVDDIPAGVVAFGVPARIIRPVAVS